MSTIQEYYGLSLNDDVFSATEQLYGSEFEIEDVGVNEAVKSINGLAITQDGSLRNNGYEFISVPMTAQRSALTFSRLQAKLVSKSGKGEFFSDRTSIHVHANCANLEVDSVRNIVLLYAMYETFFFRMVDQHRKDNIHCVPLTETYLPTLYKCSLAQLVERWHKYTALNIKPLAKLGTIEFRHMEGHNDTARYERWVTVIGNLIKVGCQEQVTRDNITEENIRKWFEKIFVGTDQMAFAGYLPTMAFNQVLDVKLGVM